MSDQDIHVGDQVKLHLDSKFWKSEGWFTGVVVKIEPYSEHRSFYWVQVDVPVEAVQGGSTRVLSVLNPKNIERI